MRIAGMIMAWSMLVTTALPGPGYAICLGDGEYEQALGESQMRSAPPQEQMAGDSTIAGGSPGSAAVAEAGEGTDGTPSQN